MLAALAFATTTPVSAFHSVGSVATHASRVSPLSMGLTLYGSQGSRSPLVNWGANEVGLTIGMGDLSKNPHPFRQIPCLTDDNDVVVFESGAILTYLQAKAKEESTDSEARAAAITSWIAWANASLDPICFLETPDGKVYDTGLKNPNKRIDTLEVKLAESDYLVDGGFSLADVAVASYLLYVPQFFPDVDLSRWPNMVRYMKNCAGREGYGEAFGANVQGSCIQKLDAMGGGEKKKMFGIF